MLTLTECPPEVTPFTADRPIRLADTYRDGRLRLDAIARYLQDLGFDHLDVIDEGDRHQGWIVRRTVIEVDRPIRWGERVHLRRWCSAFSSHWCSMRVRVTGSGGGLVETESFLIHFDEATAMPKRMSPRFVEQMRTGVAEQRLRWRPMLVEDVPAAGADVRPFPLRVADIDLLDHLNNAAYLVALDQVLAERQDLVDGRHRVVVEYDKPVRPTDTVELVSRQAEDGLAAWLVVGGEARARFQVTAQRRARD